MHSPFGHQDAEQDAQHVADDADGAELNPTGTIARRVLMMIHQSIVRSETIVPWLPARICARLSRQNADLPD